MLYFQDKDKPLNVLIQDLQYSLLFIKKTLPLL
jgi:hypothetical protein